MLQHGYCHMALYPFICSPSNSVLETVHSCPYKTWPSVRALWYQNETSFYWASTCDCLAAQGLEHGWNFTGTPGSGMRQNFSEVLQKLYFFHFLIPMCLRTQLPLGLAWEISFSSACLEQKHHTWQTLVLDVPFYLGASSAGNSAHKTKLSNRER